MPLPLPLLLPMPVLMLSCDRVGASQGVSTLPKEQLQNLIFQEMLHFHPEVISLHWGAAA